MDINDTRFEPENAHFSMTHNVPAAILLLLSMLEMRLRSQIKVEKEPVL
jgi:hypothetical protein